MNYQTLMMGCALLAWAGCESNKELGSACKSGVCSEANSVALPQCFVSEIAAAVQWQTQDTSASFYGICTPYDLPQPSDCQVEWEFPSSGSTKACPDLPFLMPKPGSKRTCVVSAAALDAEDAGLVAPGWFYGDATRECSSGHAVRFPEPPAGVTVTLHCARAQAADARAESETLAQCRLPPSSAKHGASVGEACLPEVIPDQGFNEVEAYLETGSAQCATAACLVYKLHGDPSQPCAGSPSMNMSCADPEEIRNRVYCTCRCDAPGVERAELCSCPSNFSCVQVYSEVAPEAIRGSYCVRDGTFSSQ